MSPIEVQQVCELLCEFEQNSPRANGTDQSDVGAHDSTRVAALAGQALILLGLSRALSREPHSSLQQVAQRLDDIQLRIVRAAWEAERIT
jgi:hypothetical protein